MIRPTILQPGTPIGVEYTYRNTRQTKNFGPTEAYKARQFYVAMMNEGREPKVVKVEEQS